MSGFFVWLEGTHVAITVRDSLILTGALSSVHLIGFTVVTGSALVANLNLLGVLFRGIPPIEVTRPASRGIALGLAISVLTGLLLFSARASVASVNWIFQLKMVLLVTAALFHFFVHRRVSSTPRHDHTTGLDATAWSKSTQRGTAIVGLLLWTGLALAGCAFILLE